MTKPPIPHATLATAINGVLDLSFDIRALAGLSLEIETLSETMNAMNLYLDDEGVRLDERFAVDVIQGVLSDKVKEFNAIMNNASDAHDRNIASRNRPEGSTIPSSGFQDMSRHLRTLVGLSADYVDSRARFSSMLSGVSLSSEKDLAFIEMACERDLGQAYLKLKEAAMAFVANSNISVPSSK